MMKGEWLDSALVSFLLRETKQKQKQSTQSIYWNIYTQRKRWFAAAENDRILSAQLQN